MIVTALLTGVEHGINRVLRLDDTALPRLSDLAGKVIAVQCTAPAMEIHVLPDAEGLRLAARWQGEADCRLRAPAASLLRLALSRQKTAILHEPEVTLEGDSAALLSLASILQDLELDWEYEVSRWLGPVAAHLLGSTLRTGNRWAGKGRDSLHQDLADYLAEESRSLVGRPEAEARFEELDALRLDVDRLDARIARLAHLLESSDNA